MKKKSNKIATETSMADWFCHLTNLEVVSSYVEDGKELNVLVSTSVSSDEKPGDPEPRWTLVADPQTRELLRVDFCVATDEGFEYPEYEPTQEQLELFRNFVRAA